MRPFFFILLFLSTLTAKAQFWSGDCLTDLSNIAPLDSFYFEGKDSALGIILIDTTFPGNIWHVGAVQKPGFASALSGTHALQTDTLNTYPMGNESAAIVYRDSNFNWAQNNITSFSFWHYYDTDTLSDFCILEVTIDSGKTWLPLLEQTYLQWPSAFYAGTLNNYGNTSYPGKLWWSGKSDGWKQEAICIVFPGVKGMTVPKSCGFRFLFTSDSTETNKAGWMIDNIELKGHFSTPSVSDLPKAGRLNIYPNPSADGIFTVDYPAHHVAGATEIYNFYGQKVKTMNLSTTIDISDLPKGTYHYSIKFHQTNQRFTGHLQHY